MIQLIHINGIINQILFCKTPVGNICRYAEMLGISFKQIDEKLEFLAHIILKYAEFIGEPVIFSLSQMLNIPSGPNCHIAML